jgi:TrpR-related protein YerC/YecD
MRESWYQKEIDEMIVEIAGITDISNLKDYLGRVLTPREINDMARRNKVRKMLEEGNSYSDISLKLGASTVLISKVSAQIGYGFRRSSSHTKKEKTAKIDPGKYLRRKVKYKGVNTGLSR